MGYVKYHCEDKEILEERINLLKISIKHIKQPNPVFDCPYCKIPHKDKDVLYKHIKNKHNVVRPIIIMNGEVLTNKKEHYVYLIDSLVVYFYGKIEDIYLDDVEIKSTSDKIDITEITKHKLDKKDSISIIISDYSFQLKKYSVAAINNAKTNEIIKVWDDKVSNNKQITLNDSEDFEDFNDAEKKYLEAFFNYYSACSADKNDKRKRYEDTYSILSSFYDINQLSCTVLKIIAFSWNWVDSLRVLCTKDDEFKMAYNFLIFGYQSPIQEKNSVNFDQIFVEDNIRFSLDSIKQYFNKELSDVDMYLKRQGDIDLIEDKNLRDRILALKIRRAVDNKKFRDAKNYCTDILDPLLQDESYKYISLNSKGE